MESFDAFFIGILVFLGASLLSRRQINRAYEQLPESQRADLNSLLKSHSQTASFILIGLMVVYFLLLRFEIAAPREGLAVFFAIVFLVQFVSTYYSRKKLRVKGYSPEFLRGYTQSTIIRLTGMILFGAIVWFFG